MDKTPAVPIPERFHPLLRDCKICVLSTLRPKDGLISTNPMGYVWDGQEIQLSTRKTTVKYKSLTVNPMVTFCVFSAKLQSEYLEVRGYATLSDDPHKDILRKVWQTFNPGGSPPDNIDPPNVGRAAITITPQHVSGRLWPDDYAWAPQSG